MTNTKPQNYFCISYIKFIYYLYLDTFFECTDLRLNQSIPILCYCYLKCTTEYIHEVEVAMVKKNKKKT